ncbi:hypothetical protein B484DRAFT_410963, partial [Ochromonadaceae sp. CCMP2298]
VVLPRDQAGSLSRALRQDRHAHGVLTAALTARIRLLSERIGAQDSTDAQRGWAETEALYKKQQVWKQISRSVEGGVRDQKQDFNKPLPEVLPASWRVAAEGRPKAVVEEEAEDAVCMVCFDGASVEGNRILYCDGCNATLHQLCYGVGVIPDGDFYCDRCG